MIHRVLNSIIVATLAVVANAQQPPAWHDDLADHLVWTRKLEVSNVA